MASITNLYIDIGSDFTADMVLTDDYGNILDLTGYDVYSYFKKGYGSTTVYAFNAAIIAPEINGQIQLSLPGVESEGLKPGRYLYDIQISGGGYKNRLVEGIVTFSPQVTISP